MTNRQRVLTLLSGGTPDRLPWFSDNDYWYSAAVRKGELPGKYEGDGYFRFSEDNGCGFYLQGFEPFRLYSGDTVTETKVDGDRFTTTITTPAGTLTQVKQYLPASYSHGFVKHYLESADDFPAFEYYLDSLICEPQYEEITRRQAIIGENGVTLCYTPKSPFMKLLTEYAGVESLIYMLADEPGQTERLMGKLRNIFDVAARYTVDSPAEFIMIPENLSSDVVGKQYYLEYLRPYEQFWVGEIRRAGKHSLIHMDGALQGLIGLVAETGFDIIEAATPAPVGDMTIEDADEAVGRRSILWGGLPGAMFTAAVSREEFTAYAKDMIRFMTRAPRYVLGVADQVPPDAEIERLRLVTELCEQYGKYSEGEGGA